MIKWPKDNVPSLIAFYGDPRGANGHENPHWRENVEMRIVPPFQMYYEHKPLKSIAVHKKCAGAMMAAFYEIFDKCEHNQKLVDKTGASDFAGCFNFRFIAGTTRLSNHSFGCAIDLSPATNGFYMKGTISNIVVAAFKRQGARWGGDYKSGRRDPMHFEFVSPA